MNSIIKESTTWIRFSVLGKGWFLLTLDSFNGLETLWGHYGHTFKLFIVKIMSYSIQDIRKPKSLMKL